VQPIKPQRSLRRNKKAVSPAISTMILTAAVIVMILVAMSFANNFLDKRMAENEFSANKQFMLTTGLQIDDIAWTIGRTQTVRYSSNYGGIKFQSATLNYTFEVKIGANWERVFSNVTGMILFNMPVTMYSMGNNYFERIHPLNGSFLMQGATAPTTHVFCVEKLPMTEGNYTRIVTVPSIRMLNSTISSPSGTTNYVKFYLPTLEPAISSPYNSQSVTLIGSNVTKLIRSGVDQVRITVSFLNGEPGMMGFDSSFFRFDTTTITLNSTTSPRISPNSVTEFYIGKVRVTIGQV
jgi:hypothetical protein